MKTAGYVLLSGVIAIGLAVLLNHAVTAWLPCQGEGLSCSMDGIVGFVVTLAIGGIATVVFAVVAFVRPNVRAVNIAGALLMLPAAAVLVMTMNDIALLRDGAPWYWREYQKLLQIPAPPAVAVIMQWLALALFVRGRTTVAA